MYTVKQYQAKRIEQMAFVKTFIPDCDGYGYDTDSRKALDIYFACQKESVDFRKTFPGIDLSEIEEIANY